MLQKVLQNDTRWDALHLCASPAQASQYWKYICIVACEWLRDQCCAVYQYVSMLAPDLPDARCIATLELAR